MNVPSKAHPGAWERTCETAATIIDAKRILVACILRLFQPWRVPELMKQIVELGIGSLPIILISTVFAGMVITHEIAWHMERALHSLSMIPGFTGLFIIREMGVAIPAMLMISKVGASITAEISTMKITEQLEALRLLKIDLTEYLLFPRWLASILAMVSLTLFSICVTMFFAVLIAVIHFHFNTMEYINNLRQFVDITDLFLAFTKALVFGAVFPVISAAYGLRARGGAQGVGNATTESVVTSTVVIICLDFCITFLFTIIRGST